MDLKHIVIAALLSAVALLAVVLIPLGITWSIASFEGVSNAPEFILPIEIISGVIGVFLVLTIVSVAFAALGLNDSSQALSLPQGSIRAVIAFCLILIFAIVAIFLYANLAQRSFTTEYRGLSQTQLSDIPKGQIIAIRARELKGGGTVYDATRLVDQKKVSPDATRFAQQILTTISTLVVAVAGFYFGAKTGSAPKVSADLLSLRILSPSKSPVPLVKEKGTPLTVRLESNPLGLAVEGKIEGDSDGTLTAVRHDQFEYKRGSAASDSVTLRFFAASRPDVSAELKIVGAARQPTQSSDV